MNEIQAIERINQREFSLGIVGGTQASWHDEYRNSAWVYVGGLAHELSEGDVICVMSQWGEVEDINLVREKGTNLSKGFAFVKYEDQRSTILAVDNFNGTELLKRTLRVDHVQEYKLPKHLLDREKDRVEANPDSQVIIGPGHAYKDKDLKNEHDINEGVDLWAPPSSSVQAQPLSGINEEKDTEFLLVKETKRKRKEDHDESGKKKGKREKKEKKGRVDKRERKEKKEMKETKKRLKTKTKTNDAKHKGGGEDIQSSNRMDGVSKFGGEEDSKKIPELPPGPPPRRTNWSGSGEPTSWRGSFEPSLSSKPN